MWKKLSSKVILDHPRLKVLEDKILLPDGKKTDYVYFANRGSAATIICRNDKKNVLLLKEYTYLQNKKIYQFPGGFVPKDEDPKSGAARELSEEAGLKANNLKLIGTYLPNHRKSKVIVHVYLATNLKKANGVRDHEEKGTIDKYWLKENKINELIRKGKITDADVLASWTLYKFNGKE